ncbi:formylglycine-generating enzyme family protein [Parapedobacter sp. SGR-10]|uniref:formylglycine-generating enzyme family protein n=1 Tax=Parapedobacter sp. SGR-10 TaxID=2710879 RepID=UPI0013D3B00F|nr:SUMF1/EgtB/PvdO family nonheme iron enzyme [Parapedobacter sp. SGR-10]NGF56088.1 formylglycine-generating enzyme family protein [Parapedobacter sp. SGR-10]
MKTPLLWIFVWILLPFTGFPQNENYVYVSKGEYTIGTKQYLENPLRQIRTDGLYIAKYEVTNKHFAQFVEATGYKTLAERFHNAQVFEPGLEEFRWLSDSTAYWRFPNGISRGGIENKMDHPVTCIAYQDAVAYCQWAKVRLPTLEEWEIAAKAGSQGKYFEGASLENIGDYANIWHKRDHLSADMSDSYMYTAPVGSFLPNPWGLYDIFGNVFEFCEGTLPRDKERKVAHARGGSWWCSKNSCAAFNTVFIGSVNPNASFSNLGFRVVPIENSSATSSHAYR